jgi:hypothetical protein
MDKKTGTPEGGRDERSLVQTIEERVHALLKMAETAKIEPADLLEEVWESEDFQRLSEGAKAELRAKAGATAPGEKTETATKAAAIDIGSDSRTSWIAEQVSALVKLYATSGETPDLSVIWNGEDFEKLPEDVQRAAKEWVASKYGIAAEEPAEQEAPASAPAAAEPPHPKEGRPERRENERRPKPKQRVFVGYRLERKGDAFTVVEDFDDLAEDGNTYARKALETTIALPAEIAASVGGDAERAKELIAFIESRRNELEGNGDSKKSTKLFFDCPDGQPEKLCPKWKYVVGGEKREDILKIDDLQVPEDILRAVKADPKKFYHSIKEAYDKWFGPVLQRKREDVITKLVREKYAAEVREAAPAPYPPEVVRAGARRQVEMFARIFRPESADDHVRYIIDAVRGTLEHPLGGGKRPPVDKDLLWTAVREELFARFGGEGDEASLEAVKRVMPKEDAVRRYVAGLVNEALGAKTKDEPSDERESVTAFLSAKILAGAANPDAAEKIAALASYDETAGTLTVPDLERMRGAIVNLHKHLTQGGDGGPEKKDA